MVNSRLRVNKTNLDALLGNIRCEVGEAITNWILLRHLMTASRELESNDISKDMKNNNLAFIYALKSRVKEDLILTLAGLAERKTDRVTFHFAAIKTGEFLCEEDKFRKFIERNKLKQKRDREIAHREQPLDWPEQGDVIITYKVLLKALAMAIRLMKKIDVKINGIKSIEQWHKIRKRRYNLTFPAKAEYLLLNFIV